MSSDCLFCKIIDGRIPAPRLHENDSFICIRDIQPQATTHLLVIPKRHVASLEGLFPREGREDPAMAGELLRFGAHVAWKEGLLPGGYRSVINTGPGGGQTVFHLHLHILAGQGLGGRFG